MDQSKVTCNNLSEMVREVLEETFQEVRFVMVKDKRACKQLAQKKVSS